MSNWNSITDFSFIKLEYIKYLFRNNYIYLDYTSYIRYFISKERLVIMLGAGMMRKIYRNSAIILSTSVSSIYRGLPALRRRSLQQRAVRASKPERDHSSGKAVHMVAHGVRASIGGGRRPRDASRLFGRSVADIKIVRLAEHPRTSDAG